MWLENGKVKFKNGGWEMSGGGRVSSKTSFNLIGGSIEFDMDSTRVNAEVNANLYFVSMEGANCGGDCYCDIQENGSPICMELDVIETNGNCAFASTWHTVGGFGGGGCDAGGCAYEGSLPGGTLHIKSVWSETGTWLTFLNGQPLFPNNYESYVSDKDKKIVLDTMNSVGAAIESSQWNGWAPPAPDGRCPEGGDLDSSWFSISNMFVLAKVVQGPEPTECSALGLTPPGLTVV